MKVYGSIIDASYAESYPGDRQEFKSITEAKDWFRKFVNNQLPECPSVTENAILDLFYWQSSENIFMRLSAGRKYYGEYTVKVERG
jgi:hypothetical protein